MPSIELSEGLYKRLLRQVESFDDTAESVVKRLLDHFEDSPSPRDKLNREGPAAYKDDRALLPESEYWLPILEILAEKGGTAEARDVIRALEGKIGPRLGESDRDVLAMGEVRWRNRARFARLRMKELGLVSSESPRGIWEITEKGYGFLDAERGQPAPRGAS